MDERRALITELRQRRMSYRAIGKMLGVSRSRVHQLDHGINKHRIIPVTRVPSGWKPAGNALISQVDSKRLSGRDFLREKVRVRDNHMCQICLKKWKVGMIRFDVHHLNPEMEGGNTSYSLDVENLDQMITLCHKCHLRLEHLRHRVTIN